MTDDDVAVENSLYTTGRRGVAGTLVVEKTVGATDVLPFIPLAGSSMADAVMAADGSLDRAALRRIVFSNAQEREALNAIVHPEVDRRRSLELGRQPDISVVEANDAKATGGEAVAEQLRPRNHLRGETHDQQDGRIVPVTSVVICDIYSIG